jgi:protein phosphatase
MIPRKHAHLHVAASSHRGMRHKQNEDQFSVGAYQISATDPTPVVFAMVADGIGGHLAGEVASEIATEMISQAVAESDASQPTAIMQAAILQASQAVLAQSESDEQKSGMGTTVISAWIIEDKLYVASVGNSRMYLHRNGEMHQLNIDHTWVQEAVDAGILTKEQARNHPNANIIRRYVGSRKPVEVDLRVRRTPDASAEDAEDGQGMQLLPGDRIILCSDGLNDMVPDDVICKILSENDLEDAVQALIIQANENGGKDNITVVALEMPVDSKKQLSKPFSFGRSLIWIGLFLLLGVLIVSGLGYGAYRYLNPTKTATPSATATVTETLMPTASYTSTLTYTATSTATLTSTSTPFPTLTITISADAITESIPTNGELSVPGGTLANETLSPQGLLPETPTPTKVP